MITRTKEGNTTMRTKSIFAGLGGIPGRVVAASGRKVAAMTLARLLVLSLIAALWAAPVFAGSNHYHLRFENDSPVTIEVKIYYEDGSFKQSRELQPGDAHEFKFGQKCTNTHVRRFKIWERLNDTRVASGKVTMVTGKQKLTECKYESYTVDNCIDTDGSDGFGLQCVEDREDQATISVSH